MSNKWKCPECNSRKGLFIYPRIRAKILLTMHSDTMEMIDFNKNIIFELNDTAICVKCSYCGKVKDFLIDRQSLNYIETKKT